MIFYFSKMSQVYYIEIFNSNQQVRGWSSQLPGGVSSAAIMIIVGIIWKVGSMPN